MKDLDAIDSIERDCFGADLAWTREDFTILLARPKSLSMVFSLAALPATETSPEIAAGYGLAIVRRDGSGSILSMAIHKSFRGQGLGSTILKGLCKNLQKKGATTIDLQVEDTNEAAIALYKNFGFIPVSPLADYYGPGRHGIQMLLTP